MFVLWSFFLVFYGFKEFYGNFQIWYFFYYYLEELKVFIVKKVTCNKVYSVIFIYV